MKHALPETTVLMAVSGLAVWILADSLVLGLGLLGLALVLWAVAPGVLGRIGTDNSSSRDADPAEVKEYRARNPGTTIADAIRAARK